jgi:hypothetical protein
MTIYSEIIRQKILSLPFFLLVCLRGRRSREGYRVHFSPPLLYPYLLLSPSSYMFIIPLELEIF